MERRVAATGLEVRDSDSALTLTGYASTFNEPYSMGGYTETVAPSAFQRTLGKRPDVRLLINHGDLPLARTTSGTLELDSDSRGLRVQASLDPSDPDVARLAPKLRRGDVNQMSFGFRVMGDDGDDWDRAMTMRTLRALDLDDGDVSVVTYPANPGTSAGIRAAGGRDLEVMASIIRHAERRAMSPEDTLAALGRALGYVAAVDAIVDGAQADLSSVLGVPNPDTEQDAEMEHNGANADAETRAVSDAAWDGSASRFTIEQWRRSCLIHPSSESDSKDDYKLPVREPNGALNRNAVHAAAGRIHSLKGVSADAATTAAKKLVGFYHQLKEEPPADLVTLSKRSAFDAELEQRLRALALLG
jgi:HK97 family phage prohead protease